ncbi:amidohydrolase [bacterium]|nr:MAG: amidohydrolase [bacterium]
MTLILKDATYIDPLTFDFNKCNIFVEEGNNGNILLRKSLNLNRSKKHKIIDCSGKFVTKSFVCGHHHIYSALSRGMPPPPKIPKNFFETLKYIWWNLDRKLDKEMIQASALITGMFAVKNGITFIIDHHSSPNSATDSLFIIAEALEKIGLSHSLCLELSNRDGRKALNNGIAETENYLKYNINALVGLHASFTVGDDLLKKAVLLSEKYNSGIHVHCAEDKIDQRITTLKTGKKVVNRFFNSGALNFSKTILAHCIHIDKEERKLLSKSKANIVINTESNMNNAVGTFTSKGLQERIFLGTDGIHSDMLRSAKAAYFSGRLAENIEFEKPYNRLRYVHKYLNSNRFTGDGDNNLIILNYDSPTPVNKKNFLGHFYFGLESRHIESVISNGKLIVHNKTLTNIDEKEILEISYKTAQKLWKKLI